MRPIKVLHLIKTFSLGGAETNLLNLVRTLNDDKVENHVAYSLGGEIEEQFRRAGVKLFKYSEKAHKIKSPATAAIVLRLVGYIRKNKIDIVHTHNFNAHVWGALAAKIAGVTLVEHVHDFRYMDFEEFKRRKGTAYQYRFIRWFAHWPDRVVVLTRANRDHLLSRGYCAESRIREIHNGIPMRAPEAVPALKGRFGIPEASPVVLTAARLAPEKNIELVLEIAPQVLREVPEAVFVIAGDGPLMDALKAEAENRGLKDKVRFVGFYPDITGLLGMSQVFLLPSLLELHSIAILEALSMRVPAVVSAGVGNNSDVLTHDKDVLLFDPFRPAQWAPGVVSLLKDPALRERIARNGYELCRGQFDIRQVAGRFEKLYEELYADR